MKSYSVGVSISGTTSQLWAAPLQKLRWGDRRRGKGKRGGLRVISIHIPDLQVLFMLDVYGKNEANDLSRDEKRGLQELAK